MGNIHAKDVVKFSLDARLLRVWQNTLSRSVKMTKLLSVLCVESHSNTRQTLYTTSKSNTVVTPQASLAIFVTSHHSMKRVLSGTRKESTQLELCNFLVKLHLFASFSNKCCVSITSLRLFFCSLDVRISCTESVFRDDKIIQLWRQGSFALLWCFFILWPEYIFFLWPEYIFFFKCLNFWWRDCCSPPYQSDKVLIRGLDMQCGGG